jgi:hypothetical protein
MANPETEGIEATRSITGAGEDLENEGHYLSAVMVGRNDGYGGDFLGRMQNSIESLLVLAHRHDLDLELIIVEWNPPPDRPRFCDAIEWPYLDRQVPIKIFEVNRTVHEAQSPMENLPLCEFVAKNAGIRRASGDYILVMNPDILVNAPLMRRLADRGLSQDRFYRVNRYDVEAVIPTGKSVSSKLRMAKSRCIRKNTVLGQLPAGLDSCLRYLWRNVRLGMTSRTLAGEFPIIDTVFRNPRRLPAVLTLLVEVRIHSSRIRHPPSSEFLHTEACGDFTLMSAANWDRIRGYPELPNKGLKFKDGYAVAMAAANGLEQKIWREPCRVYHQEHDRSPSSKPIREQPDFQRYVERNNRMLRDGKILDSIQNDDNWGIADQSLPERKFLV